MRAYLKIKRLIEYTEDSESLVVTIKEILNKAKNSEYPNEKELQNIYKEVNKKFNLQIKGELT